LKSEFVCAQHYVCAALLYINSSVMGLVVGSGNPLEEKHSAEGDWKDQVATRLKKLKKLDG